MSVWFPANLYCTQLAHVLFDLSETTCSIALYPQLNAISLFFVMTLMSEIRCLHLSTGAEKNDIEFLISHHLVECSNSLV